MINKPTIIFFSDTESAIEYRRANGCGGWIFAADKFTALFAFGMTPTKIFEHPAVSSHSGKLIP